MTLLDRYIARAIATPFIGSLAIAFMLLVIEELTRLLSVFSRTDAPAKLLWQMLVCLLPEYLGLAIPLALAVGILLAFRQLALASEFDILCAAGLGLARLLRTSYAYAVGCGAAMLLIVGVIEPLAAYRFDSLGYTLDSGAAGIAIKVGEFTRLGDRLTVRVDRAAAGGSLENVFVRSEDDHGQTIAASAQFGRLVRSSGSGGFVLHLERGQLIQKSPEFQTPRALAFAVYDLPLTVPSAGRFRIRGSRTSELTLPELLRRSNGGASSDGARHSAVVELNGRLAQVALALVLPLLAVAFAIPPKGSGSAVGVIVVTVAIVAYERINEYAVRVGSLSRINPILAVWLPFAALCAFTVILFRAVSGVRDGCPVAKLQQLWRSLERIVASALRRMQLIKREITSR